MEVTLKSESATTVVFQWAAVPGARGYKFTHPSGKVSHSWNGALTEVRFSKADGVFLIEPLLVNDTGQGVYPPPVDPPPPPPGNQGAALRAAYPRLAATAPLIDDTGKPARTSGVLYDGNKGPQRFKNVRRTGGPDDGFKVAGGAHDVELELCSATGLKSGGEEQGISTQRGVNRVHVYGGVYSDIGDDTLSHLFYFGTDSNDVLLAGVLGHTFSGYGWHGYPGPGRGAMVNTTIVGSKQRAGIIVYPGWTLNVVNSILWGNQGGAFVNRGGTLKFTNCVVQGGAQAGATYVNCLFEDPQLDGSYRPRNPKALTLADPAWIPPFDCKGTAYAGNVAGAVA